MKKYSVALAVVLLFSLAACGGSKPAVAPDKMVEGWQVVTTGKTGDANNLCYAVSAPVKSSGSYKGKRSAAYLMATRRNSGKIEISTSSGYAYPKDSKVELGTGKKHYAMKFKDATAWALTDAQDKAIITALQKGSDAEVRGMTPGHETTIDVYETDGFADAIKRVRELCP